MINLKHFFIMLFALLGFYSSAQDLNILMGFQATALNRYPSLSQNRYIYVGAYSNIKLYKNFYFQPGINYLSKGRYGLEFLRYDGSILEKLNTTYLDIPLLVALRTPSSSKVRFMAALGPYVAVGLSGSRYYYNANNGELFENPFKSGYLPRIDLGIYGKIGIELGRFAIYSSASIGAFKGRRFHNLSTAVSFKLFDFSKKQQAAQDR